LIKKRSCVYPAPKEPLNKFDTLLACREIFVFKATATGVTEANC